MGKTDSISSNVRAAEVATRWKTEKFSIKESSMIEFTGGWFNAHELVFVKYKF